MSDPKRATLITVGATKNEKTKVNKTVRLTINLDESNESKYPELNYKKLVIAEVRKKPVENGKTAGLNPFSDNDDDVERVARKFEQKYGGKSTYGKKSKHDDFADIGAGYDENDPFIDNTDGYDEMIPPECETFHGGFYINSGQLEFKNAENHAALSDAEPGAGRRNKRRISSSSSEAASSESSSDSESQEEKEIKPRLNGDLETHTQRRNKKSKKTDKKNPKKIRRTDSSAATSGKQTSDDNAHESADSRTSHSDSLTSKPAPSSENAVTSDSSRDVEDKLVGQLPAAVSQLLEELERPGTQNLQDKPDSYLARLESLLAGCSAESSGAARARAARAFQALATNLERGTQQSSQQQQPPTPPANNKRKTPDLPAHEDFSTLTEPQREELIVDTLTRLKALIEERKPGMMASYNAECERVQEERRKLQTCSGGAHVEKRLPKRRFPWCARARSLVLRLRALAGDARAAADLLAARALPLFPHGFVRMPTLLRQADLNKEIKVTDIKRPRINSATQVNQPAPVFTEPIQFPSSLTVTATTQKPDKTEPTTDKYKNSSILDNPVILNSFSLNKDLVIEKHEEKRRDTPPEKTKEDLYIPPNNIGSITITPVPNIQKDKKLNNSIEHRDVKEHKQKEPLIRVKSPAALNEMAQKREKEKALENIHKKDKDKHKKDKSSSDNKNDKHSDRLQNDKHTNDRHKTVAKEVSVIKEKRVNSPLHIDTNFQPKLKEKTPSPRLKIEEISRRDIETMRVAENNIPRPTLVPVHHSPTFAKPSKPPETKKKKDLVIVSDVDPLSDQGEPLSIDDSSSDVEVVEDSEKRSVKCDSVPSKDKVSERENHKDTGRSKDRGDKLDDADLMEEDISSVMMKLRDLENSQEPKFQNSFSGVITSSLRDMSSSQQQRGSIFVQPCDKDKFAERNSLNKMDGCSTVNG